MTTIAVVISFFIAVIGALGFFSPGGFVAFAQRFDNLTGLYIGAAFRIVFGLVLLYSAPASHSPEIIRIIGLITLFAGISLPFLGEARFHKLVAWWCAQSRLIIRIWAIFTLVLGLFLAFEVRT